MRKMMIVGALAVAALALGFGGCDEMKMDHAGMGGAAHANMWSGVNRAVAVIYPTKGNAASGVIYFDTMGDHVHVHGEVKGLTPNSTHGFHIHEFGDSSSDDGTAAGGHYNPEGHPHAGPTAAMHHAGDLGNITADASGVAKVDEMITGITVAGMMDPIIGRGVVVHAAPDDLKTQPTGAAGARIGVGVIGVAKNP